MDEHRVGLKPILRRVWARRGQPVRAVVRPRYEWEYVYGFVPPERGRTHWLLLPTVSTEAFSAALADFAHEQGLGPAKQIVLALDGAGWHSGTAVQVPDGLHLVPLPPYSPELQPAERLWPLVDEPLANRAFATLPALDTALGNRCVYLAEHPELVRGYTAFHWWPQDPTVPEGITVS
jgi:DDE superfamily endonuclease